MQIQWNQWKAQLQKNKQWIIPSSVGVVTFGLGVGIGYILGKRRGETIEYFEEERTIIETEEEYGSEGEEEDQLEIDYEQPTQEFEEHVRQIPIERHPGPEIESIFVEPYADWDWEAEKRNRTNPEVPYIIHLHEYYDDHGEKEVDYRQTTLTYYRGDNVIIDEHDVPVYGHEKIVGDLTGDDVFGHGSRDPSIVYVRNEKLEAEYEILLEHGYYQVEILGETVEAQLEEKTKHPTHKFRQD